MGFLSSIFNRQDNEDSNERALAAQAFSLQAALDVCQANIMMADENMVINYVNHSLKSMLKRNEAELQKHITGFNADTLIGTNVDSFHKNPAHQRRLISTLTDVFKTQLKIGPLTSAYRDWETDRKSTRLNSSHLKLSRMPSSA